MAASNDPYATEDPAHLAYHARNRTRWRIRRLLQESGSGYYVAILE